MAAVVDPAIINTVMHDFVHCYLARHFFGGTWPSVLDLVTDMQASCNNYDLDVQGYLDLNVSPQVRPSLFSFTCVMLTVNVGGKILQ